MVQNVDFHAPLPAHPERAQGRSSDEAAPVRLGCDLETTPQGGDYPGLDSNRTPLLRRARQAGALLLAGFLISAVSGFHEPAAAFENCATQAEIKNPNSIEGISVFHATDVVDVSLSSFESGHRMVISGWNDQISTGDEYPSGANVHSVQRCLLKRIDCRGDSRRGGLYPRPDRYVVSGSLAGIFEDHESLQRIVSLWSDFCLFHENISAQLPLGGVFSVSERVIGDAPQIASRLPESESERCYRDCTKRSPRFSVREDLADFKQNGERYLILLALLGCAVLCGFAHIYIDGRNRPNTDAERENARQQNSSGR